VFENSSCSSVLAVLEEIFQSLAPSPPHGLLARLFFLERERKLGSFGLSSTAEDLDALLIMVAALLRGSRTCGAAVHSVSA
jgi:hypothetical protein